MSERRYKGHNRKMDNWGKLTMGMAKTMLNYAEDRI